MKKARYIFFIFILLISLFLILSPDVIPENIQVQEILDGAQDSDIIIFFNSGGWGNTSLEKADDFGPIIREIQKTLSDWGYESFVVPYSRTKSGFLGKIDGVKDFLNYFERSSDALAEEIEFLSEKLPDKKILITGLSVGGAFAVRTYDKVSESAKDSILAITAGIPFWTGCPDSQNVLTLDNAGRDSLASGKIGNLVFSLVGSPVKWISTKISGENLSFNWVMNQFVGHSYSWDTSSSEIISFLGERMPDRGSF